MRALLTVAALLGGLLDAGCQPRQLPPRLPTAAEAEAERVIVNYAPAKLRVLPTTPAGAADAAAASGYVLLASEYPGLLAKFRPLGVTAQRPPRSFVARAGALTWLAGHVVEAGPPPADGRPTLQASFLLYDIDAKVGTPTAVALPAPCSQQAARPALLQPDGGRLYAVLRCAAERRAILLTLDATLQLLSSRRVEGVEPTELYLHQPDADYLLAGRQVLRLGPDEKALPTIGTVPPTGDEGSGDSRDLLRAGELLLVVDGAAGRVIGMEARGLGWRFEQHFATGGRVLRLRAALASPARLLIVTAEPAATNAAAIELFGTALSLADRSSESARRLRLGTAEAPRGASDHELVPVAAESGGGALLVFTHPGNSGPLVALRRLSF